MAFSEEERKQILARMREREAELKEQIAELKTTSGPVSPDRSLGRLTRLDEMNAASVKQATMRNAQRAFFDLKQSISEANSARFGCCETCRTPISMERLLTIPEARHCSACAT